MNFLISDVDNPIATYLFAHGAGAGMDSEWMEQVSALLTKNHIRVIRFEFPYMEKRRLQGNKRPPDRINKLIEHWENVYAECSQYSNLYIGGKSMGGRVASMVVQNLGCQGGICIGYPFHAPGKGPNLKRNEHLSVINKPLLILQGERDSMGSQKDIDVYDLSPNISIKWLSDGDHGLKPRVKSGITLEQNLNEMVKSIVSFIKEQNEYV